MKKQTIEFTVKENNAVVRDIGKSTILQPEIKFKGGSVKWYEDKPSKKER